MYADPWKVFDVAEDEVERVAGAGGPEVEFLRRAGVLVPKLDALGATIWADFDEVGHGIRWWQGLTERERILIGDHLYQCVSCIADNLLEAALYKIQTFHALDTTEFRLARVLDVNRRMKFPEVHSPRDVLPDKLLRLSIAGFFRALGSVFDCLAAATIGVLGLPKVILTAQFKQLRQELAAMTSPPLWADFARDLNLLIAASGPAGWDTWISDYRNMLVHRARRVEFSTMDPKAHILDDAGRPIPRMYVTSHLVRDPSLSDVEALVRQIDGTTVNLEENAKGTIEATYAATRETVEGTAALLMRAWEERKANPTAIMQPASQWPPVKNRGPGFAGFAPGTVPFQATAMVANPEGTDRIKICALDDGHNAIWRGYF